MAADPTAKPSKKARPARELISKAEMARRLGYTPAAVSHSLREGGRLVPALVGNRINVRHEAAQLWLAESEALKAAKEAINAMKAMAIPVEPEEVESVAPTAAEAEAALGPWRSQLDLDSLTEPLQTLTDLYGDAAEMQKWVMFRKHLSGAREAEKKLDRLAGRLISRTAVQRMLAHLDVCFRLLLTDAPRKIATRIAPDDMVTVSAVVRDAMEQILEAAKAQMMTALAADDPTMPLAEAAE